MSIIIISSDSHDTGYEISKSTAESLEYKLLDRKEVLPMVENNYGIPQAKLVQALDKPPSFFGSSLKFHKRCLTYIQEAVLSQLLNDNIVCQGLAAHTYVRGVSHVLRVRILSSNEDHIRQMTSAGDISREKAIKLITQNKKIRQRWSTRLLDMDETDPSGYDLVIQLDKIDFDEAVKIIRETISYRRFRAMTYSKKCLKDMELAIRVRAALIEQFPDISVQANSGTLIIETTALRREKRKRSNLIKELAGKVNGVEYIEVHVINDFFRQASETYR